MVAKERTGETGYGPSSGKNSPILSRPRSRQMIESRKRIIQKYDCPRIFFLRYTWSERYRRMTLHSRVNKTRNAATVISCMYLSQRV